MKMCGICEMKDRDGGGEDSTSARVKQGVQNFRAQSKISKRLMKIENKRQSIISPGRIVCRKPKWHRTLVSSGSSKQVISFGCIL